MKRFTTLTKEQKEYLDRDNRMNLVLPKESTYSIIYSNGSQPRSPAGYHFDTGVMDLGSPKYFIEIKTKVEHDEIVKKISNGNYKNTPFSWRDSNIMAIVVDEFIYNGKQ